MKAGGQHQWMEMLSQLRLRITWPAALRGGPMRRR
jgi:hypothetical protein